MKSKISKILITVGLLICVGSLSIKGYSKYLENKSTKSFEEKIDKNGNIPNVGIEHFDCDIEKLFDKFKLIDKSLFQITENGLTTTSELLIFKNFLEK